MMRETIVGPLLRPRSVAVVGASEDATRTSGRPIAALRKSGYQGAIYPVSTSRSAVQGLRAWPTLSMLPEVPDHVFVVTGKDVVLDIVEESCRLGVPLVTVVADGYGEAGLDGRARERELLNVVAGSNTRLVGPSSLGVISAPANLALTANSVFARARLLPGTTFVASQSGSMIGVLASYAEMRGLGIAGLVSVGSELDLSLGEICASTLTEGSIDNYLLFLESIRHGADLEQFARAAASRGRPVLAYLLGRSAQGAALATTHTGAMTGDHAVASALLSECGIAIVESLSSLLDGVGLARRVGCAPSAPASALPRIGVIATTGGGAAALVDQIGLRGCRVTPPSSTVRKAMQAGGITASESAVVDLTLRGTRPEIVTHALTTMVQSSEFDLVITVVGSSALTAPELAVQPICDLRSAGAQAIALVMPYAPAAVDRLRKAGIPTFTEPETCADVIAALWRRSFPAGERVRIAPAPGAREQLAENAAYALVEEAGIACCPSFVASLPLPDDLALPFAYPVAVKLHSARVLHKTDVGGVVLGVEGYPELVEAVQRICEAVTSRAGFTPDEVLIQPMQSGVAELMLGYRLHADAGPIVVVAAGGELAGMLDDQVVALAPVTRETALSMIGKLRAAPLLAGFRGRPEADIGALAAAIVSFSQLAGRPDIVEAEINPLMVRPEGAGVVAVDALALRIKESDAR
jgi:acetate---CoA ligase (ADP-forming)